MKTIEWTLKSGKKATVTIVATAIEDTFRDDWGKEIKTGKYNLSWDITATVEGMGVVGISYMNHLQQYGDNDNGVVASVGKLGLQANHYEMYCNAVEEEKVREECENKEYADYLNRCEAGRKIVAEYEEHVRKIDNVMTLNGHTY